MSTNTDHLEQLMSTPNESQAAMVVTVVNDFGIYAVAEGGLTAGFCAATPGEVHIMVRSQDLDRARKALEEYREVMGDIDWDDVDVGEAE
jgi:hypothetical protein